MVRPGKGYGRRPTPARAWFPRSLGGRERERRVNRITQEGTRDIQLGWGKVNDEWHLGMRAAIFEKNASTGRRDFFRAEEPQWLLDVNRRWRIKALTLFPALSREILAAQEAALKAIEDAKGFLA
jgi:hypothetical protein